MLLYRPVGLAELRLIADSGFKAFPPRLTHQPIFYPVLNEAYAIQIAHDWNTNDPASGYAGFVTRFEVEDTYIGQFPVQTVGARTHQELWIPAEELTTFNAHIVGTIAVIDAFYGTEFRGDIDPTTRLPRL
jgi:hypothetical protein